MKASKPATLLGGQTTTVKIPLDPGAGSIARSFLIHFTSNKAFVEPCMRAVLRQAIDFAKANPDDKLVIVGHTDKVDTDEYNQALSERRARSVYAFLTFGRAPDASRREWQELRQARPKSEIKSVKDTWGVRQAQHMLQDLGFYPGNVDGKGGPLTDDAVRAFRCQAGLAPGRDLDDPTWDALIKAYMKQDGFALPASRFLPNCSAADVIKWLGCGERDPVKNVPTAWRPNRRVELLFVKVAKLPCDVPPPDTLEMVRDGAGSAKWCLPKGPPANRCCFVFPALPKKDAKPAPGQWVRQPVGADTLDVTGTIKREVRNEDGTTKLKADGTVELEPVPDKPKQKFFLIAADGEILTKENETNGEPILAPVEGGTFSFSGKRAGVYQLAVQGDVLARLAEDGDAAVRGNSVCKRLIAGDKLDVVLINAPVLREIRLPVMVHLLTALSFVSHNPRPSLLPGIKALPESIKITAAEVRELFDGGAGAALTVNFIWRQARIRFEVKDVVREVFETPGRQTGSVDDGEMEQLRRECSPPNVVNVFLALSLLIKDSGEGGDTVSPESARGRSLKSSGAFVARRDRGTPGAPVSSELGRPQLVEVLAHELGHFVLGHSSNGEHVDENDPANTNRLMLPFPVLDSGGHIRLIQDEIDRSRSGLAASFACVPLTLDVQGAHRVGGELSHRYFVVQAVNQASVVNVTAQISDELVKLGKVEVQCATAEVTGRQCVVDATQIGVHEIEAISTPVTGEKVTTRAVVSVVSFKLRVLDEATDPGLKRSDPITVVARRSTDPSAVFTLFVELKPEPFAFPEGLITWSDTVLELPDPRRSLVSRGVTHRTQVTATVAGVTELVRLEVFDLSFVTALGPVSEVQIEGIVNAARAAFSQNQLIPIQRPSIFQLRADLPGNSSDQVVSANLTNELLDGSSESLPVFLARLPDTFTFLSAPFLAVPMAIDPATIGQGTLKVTRAQAGGRLQMDLSSVSRLAGLGLETVKVRGRVVHMFARILNGAKFTVADVRNQVTRANLIWSQAGIEIKLRDDKADPLFGFDDLLQLDVKDPITTNEKRLISVLKNPPAQLSQPPRSPKNPTDIHVYYIETFQVPPGSKGVLVGLTYKQERDPSVIPQSETTIAFKQKDPKDGVTDSQFEKVLAHEAGHALLRNWGTGEDHKDLFNQDWGSEMLMHRSTAGDGENIDASQVKNILDAMAAAIQQNPQTPPYPAQFES